MLTYGQALQMWEGRKRNRGKPIKLALATVLTRLSDSEDFAIKFYHDTLVVLMAPRAAVDYVPLYMIGDGDAPGWQYGTTLRRHLTEYSPIVALSVGGAQAAVGLYEAGGKYEPLAYRLARGMVVNHLGQRVDDGADFVKVPKRQLDAARRAKVGEWPQGA